GQHIGGHVVSFHRPHGQTDAPDGGHQCLRSRQTGQGANGHVLCGLAFDDALVGRCHSTLLLHSGYFTPVGFTLTITDPDRGSLVATVYGHLCVNGILTPLSATALMASTPNTVCPACLVLKKNVASAFPGSAVGTSNVAVNI